MQSVTVSAEAARALLRETRSNLHVALDARCEELRVSIDAAEQCKVGALERELVAVDFALERWRAEATAVREVLTSSTDTDLELGHVALTSRLDELTALLFALPVSVVEPPLVGLSLQPSDMNVGRVLASLPISAADLVLEAVPRSVLAGGSLCLRLSLGTRHADQSLEELQTSLITLAGSMRVCALLEFAESELKQPLVATVSPDAQKRCVYVRMKSAECAIGTRIHVIAVSVAGHRVVGLPIDCAVCRGITAPLLLDVMEVYNNSLHISPDGQIFCSPAKMVLRFDAGGLPLPSLDINKLCGSDLFFRILAYVDDESPFVIVRLNSIRIVAVCVATGAVLWEASSPKDKVCLYSECKGAALLSPLGVLLIAFDDSIFAYRLSDGSCVGCIRVPGLQGSLASNPVTGALYGTLFPWVDSEYPTYPNGFSVYAWSCAVDKAGFQITLGGPVAAADTREQDRVLAVMPAADCKTVSHLIVGSSSELLVLSLPDLALVHTHDLEGMGVYGLAADPRGKALAICCGEEVSVVPWPLPGMFPLE